MTQSNLDALVESVAGALGQGTPREDFRVLMSQIIDQVSSISPGQNWLQPGGPGARGSQPPTGVTLAVSGANAAYTLTVQDPNRGAQRPVYEISYCAQAGFSAGVTTLPASSATQVTLNLPGANYFFRVRASYDRVNWSGYSLAALSPTPSGLVSSAAISDGGAFNQTNFMKVDSVASGASAIVRVYGTAGPLNGGVRVKGGSQIAQPSASVVNVPPASTQFVGWDGEEYRLKPTLADVLADDLAPIGAVSVVTTQAPALPTVKPVISGGGIVGYNVTNGGAGATGNYTFTIADPGESGAGATTGTQTFSNGVLISVAAGNAGANYGVNTTVTASGGTNPGTPGGGTATGGNGGRMTAV